MSACSGHKEYGSGDDSHEDRSVIYSGILPAADAAGIEYSLRLKYEADINYLGGSYNLTETTLYSDSASTSSDIFRTKGDFTVERATTRTKGRKYLKLMPDAKRGHDELPLYFIIDSDTAITMTGPDLRGAETSDLNYTLKKQS